MVNPLLERCRTSIQVTQSLLSTKHTITIVKTILHIESTVVLFVSPDLGHLSIFGPLLIGSLFCCSNLAFSPRSFSNGIVLLLQRSTALSATRRTHGGGRWLWMKLYFTTRFRASLYGRIGRLSCDVCSFLP